MELIPRSVVDSHVMTSRWDMSQFFFNQCCWIPLGWSNMRISTPSAVRLTQNYTAVARTRSICTIDALIIPANLGNKQSKAVSWLADAVREDACLSRCQVVPDKDIQIGRGWWRHPARSWAQMRVATQICRSTAYQVARDRSSV